jgi:hypothetical protein
MSTDARTTKHAASAHACPVCFFRIYLGDVVARFADGGEWAHAECVPLNERRTLSPLDARGVFVAMPGPGWRPAHARRRSAGLQHSHEEHEA